MQAILEVRPDAIFIQSESSEYFHAESPTAIRPAEILNARRFLSLDLNYGRRVDSEMYEYLMDNGMTRDEYHFFLDNTAQAPLHHGERLLRHQRAPRARRRPHAAVRRDLRLRRDHAAVLRPLSPARHAHGDQPRRGARTATRRSTGSGRSGPTCCACATTASRSSASRGTR